MNKIIVIVLGRNPTLKITDTKVSRHQGKIEFDTSQGEYLLISEKPLYWKNSAFVDEFQVLESKEKIKLEQGFVIGLMPDKYIYEIKEAQNESLVNPRSREKLRRLLKPRKNLQDV